jgi:acetoin utilization deacetylase AcuC-like enzyme
LINNAAVAAKMFCTSGTQRVAILDIDFHDGNGCDVWSTALDDAIAKIIAWGAEALVRTVYQLFQTGK